MNIAAINGYLDIVKLLIESGTKLNLIGENDHGTALISAVYNGYADIVETLIKAGAKVDLKCKKDGMTALMWAVRRFGYFGDREKILNLLINAGAKVNLATKYDGYTALMWACMVMSVHTGILEMLIEKGAKLDAKDKTYGRTALMIAASNGETAKVKLLIKKGAKLDLKDNSGRTALMYAEANKHADTAEILKAAENAAGNKTKKQPTADNKPTQQISAISKIHLSPLTKGCQYLLNERLQKVK